jgi:hypothetical protein
MYKSLSGWSRHLSSEFLQNSQGPQKGLTFERKMLALWVPWALPVEGFLESFLRTGSLPSTGGLFSSFWLELPSSLQVVERELIAGGAVGFHFFTFLLPGSDDIAGIPASVDDGMKVPWRSRGGYRTPSGSSRLRGACVGRASH